MKPRENMQVSPLFLKKVRELQAKFLLKGIKKSLTDITEELVNEGKIDNIEVDKLIIKMDRRRRLF